MPRRRFTILATLLAVAVLLGVAWWNHRQNAQVAGTLTGATAQTTALHARLATLETQLSAAEKKRATLLAAPGAEPVKSPPPAPTPPKPKPPGLIDLSRNDPNLWNLFIAAQSSDIAKRYGPLLQKLGLSAEQIERFKALQMASQARYADIAAAGDAQGLKYDDPAMVRLREDAKRQGIADQAALLGEAASREVAEYERTLGARGLAHGLAAAVAFTDPLSADQAERLTQAITQSSTAGRKGEWFMNLADLDWAEADRRAQTILTPSQYAVWLRGEAHDTSIGSRLSLQLRAAYDRAHRDDLEKTQPTPTAGK